MSSLLAIAMVVWLPVWCCCAMGHGAKAEINPLPVPVDPTENSCCNQEKTATTKPSTEPLSNNRSCPPDRRSDSTCPCVANVATRHLAAPGVVTVPESPLLVMNPIAMPFMFVMFGHARFVELAWQNGDRPPPGGVPLFVLHTQLTL